MQSATVESVVEKAIFRFGETIAQLLEKHEGRINNWPVSHGKYDVMTVRTYGDI